MEKKINIYRLIWIIGIILIITIVIYLVAKYIINLNQNLPLYIYRCQASTETVNGDLNATDYDTICSTTDQTIFEEKQLISTYHCRGNSCPNIESVLNMESEIITLLYPDESRALFDAKNGNIISEAYKDYFIMINNDSQIIGYVVQTQDDTFGIMDKYGKVITDINYEQIGYIDKTIFNDYNDSYITAIKDGKYGIINITTGDIYIDFKYDELHINGNAIINVKEGLLYPIDQNGNNLLNNGYSYIFGYDNFYVTIKDKQLNILDSEENTLNLDPITIYDDYVYNDSMTFGNISIYQSENIIYINLKNNEEYTEYQYNIDTKELTMN